MAAPIEPLPEDVSKGEGDTSSDSPPGPAVVLCWMTVKGIAGTGDPRWSINIAGGAGPVILLGGVCRWTCLGDDEDMALCTPLLGVDDDLADE